MAKHSQLDKFKAAARELQTDDEGRFDERLGKIAKQTSGALLPPRKRAKKHA